MTDLAERGFESDLPLLRATVRINALIFGCILGLMAGLLLFALALAASGGLGQRTGMTVFLIGVFLPGYGAGWAGAVAGLVWGFALGGILGAGIYWINYRNVLGRLDELVDVERDNGNFPVAALRLHGPSLGVAIGAIGALGLIGATNWLVVRGTAAESFRARLLAQVLPGYAVDFTGSLVGAVELFALLFILCVAFAELYNRLAAARHRRV